MSSWRRRGRPACFGQRSRRRWWLPVVVVLALSLVPVPWKHVVSDDPLGTAWRLDGRLEIDGEVADPPGEWSWLAVGRPQLLIEVVWDRFTGTDPRVDDLRTGPVGARPALNEPAAVAIGLQHAGAELDLGVLVELRQPLADGLPESGLLAAVDGVPLTDRATWERIAARVVEVDALVPSTDRHGDDELTFQLRDGQRLRAPGPGLPYAQIRAVPTAPPELDAGITFGFARHLPIDQLRNLSLGRSHGLMVALVAYAHASGRDLAAGRHIAGTGGILGDGTVTPIGGLPAKAAAANRAGADVLFMPESQLEQLDGVDLPGTRVVPVRTLQQAIDWLSATSAGH